jgi:hypothetical protein
MQPIIQLNGLALAAAVVASFALGHLWYGPLFGKTWAGAMGFDTTAKVSGAETARALLLSLFGTALMAYVLAHEVVVWRPSTWNAGADAAPAVYGFFAAFFIWLGFIVPIYLNWVAFERKSWKVFGIGVGYQFVSLLVMAMILSFWRA